jgi:hypothetical protein
MAKKDAVRVTPSMGNVFRDLRRQNRNTPPRLKRKASESASLKSLT